MKDRVHGRGAGVACASLLGMLSPLAASVAVAEPAPIGGAFQVNVHTPELQVGYGVAPLADGRFVVTWKSESSAGSDTSGYSVHASVVDADGRLGAAEQVNAYTTGDQLAPAVTALPDGRFAVVWQSDGSPGPDGAEESVQARWFAASGAPLGPQCGQK